MFARQSGIWPNFVPIYGHLGHFLDMFFTFSPSFTLTLIYKPILKSIGPKLAILSPKITKVGLSQNPILRKCHSTKSRLNFSMNLSETFRNDLTIDFANTKRGRFIIQVPKKWP